MRSEVKHIFDRSACLSKKQVEAYLSGNMITEEVYAVEHHINGCPLCSIAIDGYQLRKEGVDAIHQLNGSFLKDHFGNVAPQLHLNSVAYARTAGKKKEVSFKGLILLFKLAVAAAACIGVLWYIQSRGSSTNAEANINEEPSSVEQTATVVTTVPEPEEENIGATTTPVTADTALTQTIASPAIQEVTAPVTIGPPPPNAKAKPLPVTSTAPINTETPTAINVQQQPVEMPVIRDEKPEPVKQEVIEKVPAKIEKSEPEKAKAPPPKPKEAEDDDLPADGLQAGKVLYERGKYTAAITKLRPEMRSDNRSRRQAAVITVARCYQSLGNKARAIEMLNMIVDEGGPEKKTAKRMLKELGASD